MKYTTQITHSGCLIRDGSGKIVLEVPTEEEALEWIEENENSNIDTNSMTLYTKFKTYCGKLPGRCFLDSGMATTNERALLRFIDSFEKSNHAKVIYKVEFHGNERFFVVIDVVDDR